MKFKIAIKKIFFNEIEKFNDFYANEKKDISMTKFFSMLFNDSMPRGTPDNSMILKTDWKLISNS